MTAAIGAAFWAGLRHVTVKPFAARHAEAPATLASSGGAGAVLSMWTVVAALPTLSAVSVALTCRVCAPSGMPAVGTLSVAPWFGHGTLTV